MIYNYECTCCKQKFSIVVGILNKIPDSMIECPNCKCATNVKRIWEKFSFVLKGSGWYSKSSETNE